MAYKDRGLWRSDIRIKGTKKRISRSFLTKKEAVEWANEMQKASNQDLSDMTLGELIVKYLDHCQLQFMPATYSLKKGIFSRLLDSFDSNTLVISINRSQMYEYLSKQAQVRTSSKANEDRKHLNALFNWALYIYNIKDNPVLGIKKFKAEGKELYTPPEADVLKVLKVAEGEAKVFINCYLLTGAREQEINRLRWKDIDFEQGRICLRSRKTKSRLLEDQWIDLAPMLAESLKWWKDNRHYESEYVFVNDQKKSKSYGQPYKNRNKTLKTLCRKAGVKAFGFHAMRRYVGSILAKDGVPIQVIQGVLRHKQLAHTERYVRGLGIDLSNAMDRLQNRMSPQQSPTQTPTRLKIVGE